MPFETGPGARAAGAGAPVDAGGKEAAEAATLICWGGISCADDAGRGGGGEVVAGTALDATAAGTGAAPGEGEGYWYIDTPSGNGAGRRDALAVNALLRLPQVQTWG